MDLEIIQVEGAVLVCNQNDARNMMHLDEKLQAVDDRFFVTIRRKMAGQACRSARDGHSIVPWQAQFVMKEIIYLVAKSTITAIDRRGLDAAGVEWHLAFIDRG